MKDLIDSYVKKKKFTRLQGDVSKTQNQLFLIEQRQNAPIPAWIDYVKKGLLNVLEIAKQDNDLAWRMFKSYRRMLILDMNKDECLAEALYLLNSATRLDDTSKSNILALFPTGYLDYSVEKLRTNLDAATEIKDDFYDNEYYKLYMSQLNIRYVLAVFLACVLVCTVLYSIIVNFTNTSSFLGSPKYIITLEVLGFLGAVFSIVTKLTNSNTSDVTTSLQDDNFPIMRSFIGPGAALIMYLFVQSGIINSQIFLLSPSDLSSQKAIIKTDSLKQATDNLQKTAATSTKDSLKKVTPAMDTSVKIKNLGSVLAKNTKDTLQKSNAANIVDNTKSGGVTPSYLMYVLAFLAGFSEKLIVQILDKLANKVK